MKENLWVLSAREHERSNQLKHIVELVLDVVVVHIVVVGWFHFRQGNEKPFCFVIRQICSITVIQK